MQLQIQQAEPQLRCRRMFARVVTLSHTLCPPWHIMLEEGGAHGCRSPPVPSGCGVPPAQRLCVRCQFSTVYNEYHLVFERPCLKPLRDGFLCLVHTRHHNYGAVHVAEGQLCCGNFCCLLPASPERSRLMDQCTYCLCMQPIGDTALICPLPCLFSASFALLPWMSHHLISLMWLE